MRRMRTEKEIKDIANKSIILPINTNLDTITKSGMYKVNNYPINGVNYDGTLVVLPWDSNYFRQVFYTIDNNDPNPIFTRVRVNKSSPWKKWEIFDNSIKEYDFNITHGTTISNTFTKCLVKNNELNIIIEGNFSSDGDDLQFKTAVLPEEIATKIIRYDGKNIYQDESINRDDNLICGGVALIGFTGSGTYGSKKGDVFIKQSGYGKLLINIASDAPYENKNVSFRTTLFLN